MRGSGLRKRRNNGGRRLKKGDGGNKRGNIGKRKNDYDEIFHHKALLSKIVSFIRYLSSRRHFSIGLLLVVLLTAAFYFTLKEDTFNFVSDFDFEENFEINETTTPQLIKIHSYLSSFICSAPNGYCHPSLAPIPSRRTHKHIKKKKKFPKIAGGDKLLVLPRDYQIWDLDALRNRWIRKELFGASHDGRGGGRFVDSGAYLAAYLVRLDLIGQGKWVKIHDREIGDVVEEMNVETEEIELAEKFRPFFEILPSYRDLEGSHPTLWPSETVNSLLGKYTLANTIVGAYRDMIHSEYRSFTTRSPEFGKYVSFESFAASRIHVLSRSFGTGPPTEKQGDSENEGEDEMEYYQGVGEVNLTLGCRAMSPILDMWDHHPNPNAEWRYLPDRFQDMHSQRKGVFVIRSSQGRYGLTPGQDVYVSYGKYTDSHLFAKFGFVNGDGSGYVDVSFSSLHRMLDVGLGRQFSYAVNGKGMSASMKKLQQEQQHQQAKELTRYLQFDDGYSKCIRGPNHRQTEEDIGEEEEAAENKAWELKKLKLKYLRAIADSRERWTVLLPPRNPRAKPPAQSTEVTRSLSPPPKFDPTDKSFKFDASGMLSTCRLMTLTHEDYDGNAIQILRESLESFDNELSNNGTASQISYDFHVERQGEALEYRAMSCFMRLGSMMLGRYPSNPVDDWDLLNQTSSTSSLIFQSREWYATHVRMGEMQGLELLVNMLRSGAMQMAQKAHEKRKPENGIIQHLFVRANGPCPLEYSLELVGE